MKRRENNSGGYVLLCLTLCLVIVIGVCALVLDLGLAYKKNAQHQLAADIAAYAGALILPDAASDSEVFTSMDAYANANGIPDTALADLSCGIWSADEFHVCGDTCEECLCGSCLDAGVNAVRVGVDDPSLAYFARIFQVSSLPVRLHSVALIEQDVTTNCVRPFGILSDLVPVEGQSFTIDRASPGNWGKLNIDPNYGNLSGRPAFQHAMTTNECSSEVQEGGLISSNSATGFAGMDQVFRSILATRMIIPLTSAFGNGQTVVQIREFAEIEIVNTRGNGANWQGTFRVIRRSVTPTSSGVSSTSPPRWVQ